MDAFTKGIIDFEEAVSSYRNTISQALIDEARKIMGRDDIVAVQMSRYEYRIDTVGIVLDNDQELIFLERGRGEFGACSSDYEQFEDQVSELVGLVENFEDYIAVLWPHGEPILFDPTNVYGR